MKYTEFRQLLRAMPVFSLDDVRRREPEFDRRRLNEWQDKGYIRKIVRGFYFFDDHPLDEYTLFHIANRIYHPSYISLESALSYYGFIPESVQSVTSVGTRRTYEFSTELGRFLYRSIKPGLFWGYDVLQREGLSYLMATPEKALLDYMYLHTELDSEDSLSEMRIAGEMLEQRIDRERFDRYVARFDNKSLAGRVRLLWSVLRYA